MFFRLVDGGFNLQIKDNDQERLKCIEKDLFQLVYKDALQDGVWHGDLETNKSVDLKILKQIGLIWLPNMRCVEIYFCDHLAW